MGKDLITVTLIKDNPQDTWGFRLVGGRDKGQPLAISQVVKDSLAAKVGLNANDLLVSIAGKDVFDMTHDQAERTILDAGDRFQMVIERQTAGDRKISFEKSAMTVSLKLGGAPTVSKVDEAFISNVPVTEDTPSLLDTDSVNFKKFEKTPADISASKTLEPRDLNKPYNRKDWNCPWVKKDGSGLKAAIRCVDEVMAPAKTSHQHFYSEPRSILASDPVLSPEQIQELIRQHGGDSRPMSRNQGIDGNYGDEAAIYQQQLDAELQEEIMQQQDRVEMIHREQKIIQEEETYPVKMVARQGEDRDVSYYREREEDSQAPPDLETVTPLVAAMVGDQTGYEPSADELIEVLKNLENLAAANPSLYKSIVDQIRGSQQQYEERFSGQETQYYNEQEQMMNGSAQYENEFYQEQMYQQESYEERRVEEMTQMTQHREEVSFQEQQQVNRHQEQREVIVETPEERAHREKMERLEREANEEVKATLQKQRELKMAKLHPPPPPKPKEITVVAGDGKKVTITLGGEPSTEDSRKQVAEAAGLKHVPLPDFDGDFSSSAWAGSLKKTEKSKLQVNRSGGDEGGSPWAGSLRHVKEPSGRKKSQKKEDDSLYGTAPWMGTLRHVVHDNKVTKHYGVNQFQSKRYPDEDAGNPFEAQGGTHARPAFPLTPAAIVNGTAITREEMARKQDAEEVARVRDNIKMGGHKSETVATALLNALMPKLLKVHETKYPAIDRDEATRIMEEILSMQVGLNVDQQADANEEAEMMIRAIMQDEIGAGLYSKMADDLEKAAQMRKKAGKSAAKKKKVVKKGAKLASASQEPISA